MMLEVGALKGLLQLLRQLVSGAFFFFIFKQQVRVRQQWQQL